MIATCACRGRPTWTVTSARTTPDVLSPRVPLLPLIVTPPCPKCGADDRVLKIDPGP